ncbi:MAG: ATP-binding cassette domain-containing protein [Nitrososphaerota archaeon]
MMKDNDGWEVVNAELSNLKRMFGLGWELNLSYLNKNSKKENVEVLNNTIIIRGSLSKNIILLVRQKFIEYLILKYFVEPYLLNGGGTQASQKLITKLAEFITNTRIALDLEDIYNLPPRISVRVNKVAKIHIPNNKRAEYVAKVFGILPEESRKIFIYKDFKLDVSVGDIICILGESGAGKSLLLKLLSSKLYKIPDFGGVVYEDKIIPNEDEILINGVGKNVEHAVEILSYVGLSEPMIFLKPYSILSEGQKYRYRIAKMLDSGKRVWVLDEFCSKLDTITAKVVAFSIGKLARKVGATLIVATPREEIITDLAPNTLIIKKLGPHVEIRRDLSPPPQECSILKHVVIEEGDMGDYKKLAQFHYRGVSPGYVKKIYKATIHGTLAGVIVYSYPFLYVKYRKVVLPDMAKAIRTSKDRSLVNQLFTRISRVIVAPRFRAIGLGTRLVRDTLMLADTPYVEMLAVMAKYNRFAEKAGMLLVTPHEVIKDAKKEYALMRLREFGFDIERLHSLRYNLRVLSKLSSKELDDVEKIIRPVLGNLAPTKNGKRIEIFAKILQKISLKPYYLIWKNPRFPEYPEPMTQQFS